MPQRPSAPLDPMVVPPSIPRGWRRLRRGTRLRQGDRYWWCKWHDEQIDTLFTTAVIPMTFIRRIACRPRRT